MIPGHRYTSMMVTGVLHCLLSVGSVITTIIGLSTGSDFFIYFVVTLLIGLYMGVVGGLGIVAGLQRLEDNRTRQFKIAYMVTAILSACIFCPVASRLYGTMVVISRGFYLFMNYYTIGSAGVAITVLEFILAIVSSSLCCYCCCSPTTPNTTIIVQAPPQQIITAVPGNTTVQYQYPPNNTMQYTTTGDGAVSYQPDTSQQSPYQTKP